jgi:hypothetical protein
MVAPFSVSPALQADVYWPKVDRQQMGSAMATAEQVKALLKSYCEGDLELCPLPVLLTNSQACWLLLT